MMSPKQQEIINLLQTRVNMTAAEIAAEVGSETKATSKHLRLLEDVGKIYVCEWRNGKYGVLTKAYKLGEGESVGLVSKRKKKAGRPPKDDVVDVYIAPNNGWVSRIIGQDPRMSHADHIRYMNTFRPHPDIASSWLFNEPKVELEGNKHDFVQA